MQNKLSEEKNKLATERENTSLGNRQEINALNEKNKRLNEDLLKAEETSNVLKEILNEIRRLKMSPLRNLTGDSIDDLREERDRLVDENLKLKHGEVEDGDDQKGNDKVNQNIVKYLRSKVSY